MGLSICYEFRLHGDAARARDCLTQLRDFALTQPFLEVGELLELPSNPDNPAADELSRSDEQLIRRFAAQYGQKQLADGSDVWVEIPARHVLMFAIQPAKGAETAQIGLATHAAVVEHTHRGETMVIETGLTGQYSWTQCCKTQYAGLQQHGGADHFVRAHVALVHCLDFLQSLGVEVSVSDDSGYWTDRDEDRLRDSLDEWNEMVAAFAGQVKDGLPEDLKKGLSAPILTAPDFEHLEAKGLDDWTPDTPTP